MTRSRRLSASRRQRQVSIEREKREVDRKLNRLYSQLSEGKIELDDTLQSYIQGLRNEREELIRLGAEEHRRAQPPQGSITPHKVEQFSEAIMDRLRDPKKQVRKAYLRLFIERIELSDDEVRI